MTSYTSDRFHSDGSSNSERRNGTKDYCHASDGGNSSETAGTAYNGYSKHGHSKSAGHASNRSTTFDGPRSAYAERTHSNKTSGRRTFRFWLGWVYSERQTPDFPRNTLSSQTLRRHKCISRKNATSYPVRYRLYATQIGMPFHHYLLYHPLSLLVVTSNTRRILGLGNSTNVATGNRTAGQAKNSRSSSL